MLIDLNKEIKCLFTFCSVESIQSCASDGGNTTCKLCMYVGGTNPAVNAICEYVTENVGKVSWDTIGEQVAATMLAECEEVVSKEDVRIHFEKHAKDRRVVMDMLLEDLMEVAQVAKKDSIALDDDGNRSVNPKTAALFLDTVKQIACILRIERT